MSRINIFKHLLSAVHIRRHPRPVAKIHVWQIWIVVVLVALFLGLFGSVAIYNVIERRQMSPYEVTFIDPHQAIVFWTTTKDTKGYVKYGAKENDLSQMAYQTSSVPGKIHAVLLTDVPLGGVYFSLHTEADSPFLWTKIEHLEFDPTTIE